MHKFKVGIVGPKDSVDLISDVARDFSDQMTTIPFDYETVDDIIDIVNHEHEVDVWLFSGQVPYTIAKEQGIRKQAFFPQLTGSSLTKSLLEIGYRDQRRLKNISFDTIPEHDIHETFKELGLEIDNVHILSYEGYRSIDELVSFHERLFRQGEVDVCVTCVRSVYENLKRLGVPVYRITPTRMSIRQCLTLVNQQGKTLQFQRAQIAILLIQVQQGVQQDPLSDETVSYSVHRQNLKLQEVVLNYTERISGTFVYQGNGRFIIISTRGSIEESREVHPTSLLEDLFIITDSPTNIGVGYGTTAWQAEQNAQLALLHAKNYDEYCVFQVDENGVIEGPLQREDSIEFEFKTETKELRNQLRKAGVSVKALSKVLAVQQKLGKDSITAVDIAKWLKMSTRNARRILYSLERIKLAEIVGEEAPTERGRPRKLYRITVDWKI